MRRPELRCLLKRLSRRDHDKRMELVRAGELGGGYHPEMERVHRDNAWELDAIVDRHGWPGRSSVGEKGETWAWMVVQHAISMPDFQRRMLTIIERAARDGEAPWEHYAKLLDRTRFYEGEPQEYGTNFDWDPYGRLSPTPVRDPENVDERRAEIGLGPIARQIEIVRKGAKFQGELPPDDLQDYREQFDAWCRDVGWRQ